MDFSPSDHTPWAAESGDLIGHSRFCCTVVMWKYITLKKASDHSRAKQSEKNFLTFNYCLRWKQLCQFPMAVR